MHVAEVARHSFITDGLTAEAVVVDLGMNRGEFSRRVSAGFGCRIVGVEPVPELYAALPKLPRVVAEPCAVTADGQPVQLHLNAATCATIDAGLAEPEAATIEVPGITLEHLLSRHGVTRVALAKFDIEGAEVDVLERIDATTLSRIDQLTIEFHDFLDPRQGPGVERVVRRLERDGFTCLRFSLDNTDVLFVNERRLALSRGQRLWLAARYKYPRGVVRRLRRLLKHPASGEVQ
jgi:FkbM family methyltransferase